MELERLTVRYEVDWLISRLNRLQYVPHNGYVLTSASLAHLSASRKVGNLSTPYG